MTERLLADAWPDNTVWLASYPRSGNSYLRAILWNCFGLRSGSLYADDLQGDVNVARQIGHYEAAAHGVFSAPFRRLPLVKTHEWPVDGRKAIYVVRDGRASCRSHWHFLRASGYDVEFTDIIAGRHRFGSWSGHVLAWNPMTRPDTLFLRYEDLTQDFDQVLIRLAGFLNVAAISAVPPPSLAAVGLGPHWLSPGLTAYPPMTACEEALFDRLHGETMAQLGYFSRPAARVSPAREPAPVRAKPGADCAAVWLCWGAAYLEQARVSARTTLSLGIDRVLITDAATARLVEPDGLFSSVVVATFGFGNNLDKSQLGDLIPSHYDTILFLDTDTQVLGDLSLGFEKARQHGIAIVPAPHYNLEAFFGFDAVMRQLNVVPSGQMQYNSGVIFCHLTETVRAVLGRWRDLCRIVGNDHPNDQPFLSLAFDQLGFQPYVLSPVYNYCGLGELAVGDIRIWHSHYPVPADLSGASAAWPPRRYLDGARVAY